MGEIVYSLVYQISPKRDERHIIFMFINIMQTKRNYHADEIWTKKFSVEFADFFSRL